MQPIRTVVVIALGINTKVMQMDGHFHAGKESAPYSVVYDLCRSPTPPRDVRLVAVFLELWCHENCMDDRWVVDETDTSLRVGFSSEEQVTLFMMSEEYGFLDAPKFKFVAETVDA